MSDDLIKRSDAIKALCDITNKSDMPEDWHRGISVSISALHRVPSADRPQGKWIDAGSWMGFECSRCECHSRYVTPFCPQCGARMKGVENDRV